MDTSIALGRGNAFVLVLHPGRTARLERSRGARLRVTAGRLWVTLGDAPDDHFIGAGESLAIARDRGVVIESDGRSPAVVRLLPARDGGATSGHLVVRLVVRLVDPLGALAGRVSAWRRRRATRDALCGLDDRMLRDIGVPDSERWHARQWREQVARGRERALHRCVW